MKTYHGADDVEAAGDPGAAFSDMPRASTDLVQILNAEDTEAADSMVNEGGRLACPSDGPEATSRELGN